MKMLELDNNFLFGTTGSGNQKKLWVDNKLIKFNSRHREAEKEVSASVLGEAFGLCIVKYSAIKVSLNGNVCNACVSDSFLETNDDFISVANILDALNVTFKTGETTVDVFNKVVSAMYKYTGFSKQSIVYYLLRMLTFDFIICNEDRHLNNVGVIFNVESNVFRWSPIFDNGVSFLDTDGSITNQEVLSKSRKLKTKPFSSSPKKNLIDLVYVQNIVEEFLYSVNYKCGSIDNLNMNKNHLKIAKGQINKLITGDFKEY